MSYAISNVRQFSCFRRRPHIVDLLTPFVYGVTDYTIKWAQNFDGVFATIIDSNNCGFYDSNIPRNKTELQNTQGQVRITFDPTTYSIDDTKSFWLQLWETPTGGASTQVSGPTLLLPDTALHGQGIVTIHGAAPVGASSANALQLDLPFVMQNFQIHNEDAANPLFVSTEAGGPEQELGPGLPSSFPQYETIWGAQSSLFVRSTGAPVLFSATFTLAFPR